MQPVDGLKLGEVENSLGCHSRGEAVGDINFPETAGTEPLTFNQVGKAFVTELLLRK